MYHFINKFLLIMVNKLGSAHKQWIDAKCWVQFQSLSKQAIVYSYYKLY